MKYISITALILTLVFSAPVAQAINNPVLPVNEPMVSNVTSTSATISVSPEMANTLSVDQKAGLYFEYIRTNQVCIMIYPTPESCLPQKTQKGNLGATLTGLKPSTSYTVSYKVDNTIMCIQAPCPGNGLESSKVEFTTTADGNGNGGGAPVYLFSRNLMYGSRGADVTALQDVLRTKGYLSVSSSGYFGLMTFRGVKMLQKNDMHITATGFVGPLTRNFLNGTSVSNEEYFEGTIQAASTACYADGVCSVTIGGKVVVTTIGWTGGALGSIKGTVNNIGDIVTSKIGAKAKVYAKKTADGYTLYGNTSYYIEVQ